MTTHPTDLRQQPGVCIDCGTVLLDCPGIGPYCPNDNCARIDDQRPTGTGQQPAQLSPLVPGGAASTKPALHAFPYQPPPDVATGSATFAQPEVTPSAVGPVEYTTSDARLSTRKYVPAQPESGEVVRWMPYCRDDEFLEMRPHPRGPWVSRADYNRLQSALTAAQQRMAELERELANEQARGIHSCHDQCQRPLCVAERRIRELETLNAERNRQNALAFQERDRLREAWQRSFAEIGGLRAAVIQLGGSFGEGGEPTTNG